MSRAANWKQRNVADGYREDWETPPFLFAEYDREFRFTLDVCATPENAKCAQYFTKEMNGLSATWAAARCWMNPPYGRAIADWVTKAHMESRGDLKGGGALVVCLLPSRTDTAWWHDHVIGADAEVRFLRGRVRFGGAPWNAPFPSAIVIYRPVIDLMVALRESLATRAKVSA